MEFGKIVVIEFNYMSGVIIDTSPLPECNMKISSAISDDMSSSAISSDIALLIFILHEGNVGSI